MSKSKKIKLNISESIKNKFQESWQLAYGFIEKNGKAVCVLCQASVAVRKFCVERHFQTTNKSIASLESAKLTEYLKSKLQQFNSQSKSFVQYLSKDSHLSQASLQLANGIAKSGKSLGEGEFVKSMWLSCADTLFHDFPNRAAIITRIKDSPASRKTVTDRVLKISEDVNDQLMADLEVAEFYSLCLDDSNDVNSQSRLIIFIRYESDGKFCEEPIKLLTLSGHTTGEDVCKSVFDAYEQMNVDLNKIVAVTTDGASSMIGKHKGFVSLFRSRMPHPILGFHCIIHQEALWSKDAFSELDGVMKVVTKVVNYITARPLNKRLFKLLLEEVQSQYSGLLMYNDVRWLSWGKVLTRFVERLNEIRLFLNECGQSFPELSEVLWLSKLHFFADFSQHFNDLNIKLKGRGKTIDSMFSNVKGFSKKLPIFEKDLLEGEIKCFPHLRSFLTNISDFATPSVSIQQIKVQLAVTINDSSIMFLERFSQFRELETTFAFIKYPHTSEFHDLKIKEFDWLDIKNMEMEIIDFQASVPWTLKFKELNQELDSIAGSAKGDPQNTILEAWNSLPNTFQRMKRFAKALLSVFSSSYSCEQYFSSMNFILTKNRNRITEETSSAYITLKVTNYEPRLEVLSASIQQQKFY